MNSGYNRGSDKAGIRQGQVVKVVVDNVIRIAVLEEFRNVQALPNFWNERAIFFIASRANGMQFAAGLRIGGRKQGHVMTPGHQSLGQQ